MVSTDSCAETSNASKDPSKATKILIMHLPSQKWDKWNETKILFSEIAGKISSSQRQKWMAGGSCRCLFSMTTERTQRHTRRILVWDNTDSEWLCWRKRSSQKTVTTATLFSDYTNQNADNGWGKCEQASDTQCKDPTHKLHFGDGVAIPWVLNLHLLEESWSKEPIRIQPALGRTGVRRWSWSCWMRWPWKSSANVCCLEAF